MDPLPRTRKRLAAPLLVFILGMMPSLHWCSRWRNPSALSDLKSPCHCERKTDFRSGEHGVLRAQLMLLLRRQHHHHLAPFQLGPLLHRADGGEIGLHALQERDAELLVGHLAAAEAQRDLGLVAFGEEAREVADLDLV